MHSLLPRWRPRPAARPPALPGIDAVELAEHALRLTPPARAERSERLLALAGYLEAAGEQQRVTRPASA